MWIFKDSSGNHFTVVESLSSKSHFSQSTSIDELEHLRNASGGNKPSDENIRRSITGKAVWHFSWRLRHPITTSILGRKKKEKEKAFNFVPPAASSEAINVYSQRHHTLLDFSFGV